ncbi:MAG: phosphatase PAP2 family protein [Prevotellaceae bacterium]|jgi:undecaprenyl-diphosphatase|nr:phosphatase PAP2 family protein [Prevotellaceae bacterium]
MLEKLLEFDRLLFLLINGAHISWIDFVMKTASVSSTWIPLYLLLLFLFFYYLGWRKALMAIGAAGLCFLLTDRLSVMAFKDVFCRLRPSHEPTLVGMVHLLESQGGLYGFVSSHAANLFGLATLTTFILKKKWLSWLLFAIVTLVGYSRIYVGKHYPLDVLCGALLGALIGWLIYKLYKYLCSSFLTTHQPNPTGT